MKSKKIANIVFFKFYGEQGEMKQTCIFYKDGTAKMVSYEEGLEACEEVVKERKIISKNAFQEMINKDIIHVISGNELEANFQKYISKEIIDRDIIEDAIEEQLKEIPAEKVKRNIPAEIASQNINVVPVTETAETSISEEQEANEEEQEEVWDEEEVEETENENNNAVIDNKDKTIIPVVMPVTSKAEATNKKEETKKVEEKKEEHVAEPEDKEEISDTVDVDYSDTRKTVIPPIATINNDVNNFGDNIEDSVDEDIEEQFELNNEKPKKKGILRRLHDKLSAKKGFGYKVTAIALAAVIALSSFGYALSKKAKEGVMHNSNITTTTVDDIDKNRTTETTKNNDSTVLDQVLIESNNNFYDNYTYDELLQVTNNSTQKRAMANVATNLRAFNGDFAKAYIEEGKEIKAALSFEEMIALQQAYNEYSKQDLHAIFNGADIRSSDLSRAYKNGSLQLMGAYVIETRENQVDVSSLIESEEGKEFYHRYHEMFLACKEAEGQEKLDRVNEFYKSVREDFPITQEVRTEGISHSDAYGSIEAYKLAVTPMIAAAEMMYQNLDIDYTLDDSEIDFLNDIGLCNYADKTFERIETITLSCYEEDETNPTYEQYKNSIIRMLKADNMYVTDDAHRDLSQLDRFQDAVNWHFEYDDEGYFIGETYYTTETHQETNTWTEQQTTTREKITIEEKEIPKDEKEKIDKEIAKENEKAKKKAEEKAEEKRKEIQEEEDKKAEKINEEIKEEEQDLQDKIEDANKQIEENNKDNNTSNDIPVNESDFGDHNVDFDDEHSDDQGNLDDSVENITTDPTGDQTGEDLPDPNVTGAEFDKQAEEASQSSSQQEVVEYEEPVVEEYNEPVVEEYNEPVVEEYNEPVVEVQQEEPQQNIVEYEEPVNETPEKSNEEIVNDYIEDMANSVDENEVEKELQK